MQIRYQYRMNSLNYKLKGQLLAQVSCWDGWSIYLVTRSEEYPLELEISFKLTQITRQKGISMLTLTGRER
jgi:hypothetical protein